jgi:Tol biopolymer transport system component
MNPLTCFANRSILILFLIFLNPNVSAVAVINITQLTYGTDTTYGDPAWSPDGKEIVYGADSGNNYSISVMNANGNNPVKLTGGTVPYHTPRWSPDGSKIVFERDNFIYIMDSNGSNQRMLLAPAGNPGISPDGKYIVFDAGAISIAGAGVDITHIEGGIMGGVTPEMGGGIVVMNINDTNIKRLTNDPGDEIQPSWSPDSKKIVFTEGGTIIIMNVNGSNARSTGQGGYYAKMSPNGKYIAFLSERAGDMFRSFKLYHIYIMDIDGTNVTQLTFDDKREDGLFDWSPDGTKIVFGSEVPPTAPSGISNIFVMTLDFNATSPTATPTATPIVTQTPIFTPTATQSLRAPGFSLLVAIVSLSTLVLIKRRL